MKTRVIIVDDHPIIRMALRNEVNALADAELVGEAEDGRAALELLAKEKADVVFMDLMMKGMGGLEALKQIRKQWPMVRVVMLSAFADDDQIWACLRAGAAGYIEKGSALSEYASAIRAVTKGDIFFNAKLAKRFATGKMKFGQVAPPLTEFEALSPRQREVLQLIGEGMTTKEIADVMKLSVKTAEYHRMMLLKRLRLSGSVELALFAQRNKMLS